MELLLTPQWTDIKDACQALASEIRDQQLDINYVVGVTRGGLAPAVVISHMLDIPTIPVSYSSHTGKGDNKFYDDDLPDLQSIIDKEQRLPGKPAILIVDDISDSGETFADLHKIYMERGHKVYTLTLYHKEGSVFSPDFIWQQIPKDAGWITFPWEQS